MSEREQARETEKVVRRVMKKVGKYDHVGKPEFEEMLQKVVEQVHKNTGIGMARITEATQTVISDMPHEYGLLGEEQRSWESMIGYLYAKHLQVLGVVK